MDNCLIFPCFTGACLALAEMFSRYSLKLSPLGRAENATIRRKLSQIHISLAELLGINEKRTKSLSSFSSGQKSRKLEGYQAPNLTDKALAASVSGAAG